MNDLEDPGFSLPIHLTLERSDANTHTQNDGDEINRKNVTDDSTDGFLIQIRLEKVTHSIEPDLLTFIGLEMRFEGIDDRRRFRYVEVNIRFEDSDNPLTGKDPEVISLWPDGPHVWTETPVKSEINTSVESGLQGGPSYVGGSAKGAWAKKTSYGHTDRATFSGTSRLLKKKVGNNNGVFLRLNESRSGKSGVIKMIHTGILLQRKEGTRGFRAYFEIKAEADMRFSWVSGLKKLRGVEHKTDPVNFEPSKNYCGRLDLADLKSPGSAMVQRYGDVMAWIELDPVRTYERKEEGWQESDKDVAIRERGAAEE